MLRLRTLGGLSIERDGDDPALATATAARRRLALLAVIATDEPVPRDRLLALFWPESDTERARHALDQTLYSLKREGGGVALVLGREELTLNASAIASDIGELRAAVAARRHSDVASLYTGAFLDGVHLTGAAEFERWVDEQRARVTRDVERSLEALATDAALRADHHLAAQWWQRLAALDPRKTRVVVSLMTELAASGDRAGALRQAEVYRTLVQDDLEVEPNPAIAALADRLRREPMASPVYSPLTLGMSPVSGPPAAPAAPDDTARAPAAGERYVIEREIGRGGTATVYLARDVRNARPVALKMLRPALAAGLGVDRFRQEITVTANLQHPHILPVLESGEADGTLYFVMPFVEGESLRERLVRERQLPVTEAIRLAQEVAGALAYAHARGIIHRDVKPENIMVTSGHAVVADFGLALALGGVATGRRRTDPGIVLGTLAYLSPEQASGTRSADARSDQYSLAYVLYEMLAGKPPFDQSHIASDATEEVQPPSIRAARPEVPDAVERVILRALSRDPEARFESVDAFSTALGAAASGAARVTNTRRTRIQYGAAVAVVLVAAASLAWSILRGRPIGERAWVVLAGIENRTGDSAFNRSLDALVEAGLEQSAYINLVPRARVQQALSRMRRDDSSAARSVLDEGVAREVAQREGAQAVVVGAIDRVDTTYLLSLRVVRAASGSVLRSHTSVARSRGEVVDAVDDVVRRLRRSIGESADSLAKYDRPLPRATTRSLDALRSYGDGLAAAVAGDRAAAMALWNQAVAIDSEFALAHAELGAAYYQVNNPPQGEVHFGKALRLLDRLTDRERLQIRAAAESQRGHREAAIQIRRALLTSYPDDGAAWFQLGYDYLRLGRRRDAIDAFNRIVAHDSANVDAWVNIATAHKGLEEYDDALRSYRRAFALRPQWLKVNNVATEYGATLALAGHRGEVRAVFDSLLAGDVGQQRHGARSIGLLLLSEGRYSEAVPFLRRAVTLSEGPGNSLTLVRNQLFLATAFREMEGGSDSSRAEVRAAYAVFRHDYLDPVFLFLLGKALARQGDIAAAREVLDTIRVRAETGPPTLLANIKLVSAEIALARGHADSAVNLLWQQPTTPSAVVMESMARALDANGRHAEAAKLFEELGAKPATWWGKEGQDFGVVAFADAGRAYEAAGDNARARELYRRFISGWPTADSGLVSVQLARSRLARLDGATR